MPHVPPDQPAHHTPPAHHAQRHDAAHIAGVAAITVLVVLALAYLVAGYESGELYGLVRAVLCVALLALLIEVRVELLRREQRRHEEQQHRERQALQALVSDRLNRAEFAEGYIARARQTPPSDGPHLRSV